MRYDDLDENEKSALAALVRVVVRADGEFSVAEVQALTVLARELETACFWERVNSAHQLSIDELAAMVESVRARTRVWMYGVLLGLAAVDGVSEEEGDILDWLAATWELHS